jgi:hypothetical protein
MDVVGTAAYLIITTLFHFDMSLMMDLRDVGTHWACVREIVIPMRTVQPGEYEHLHHSFGISSSISSLSLTDLSNYLTSQ